MIYFVGDGDVVKIGFTSGAPESRLVGLQVGNPRELVLLGSAMGDEADEAGLHAAFADSKIRGEWYQRTPTLDGLLSCIAENRRSVLAMSVLRWRTAKEVWLLLAETEITLLATREAFREVMAYAMKLSFDLQRDLIAQLGHYEENPPGKLPLASGAA